MTRWKCWKPHENIWLQQTPLWARGCSFICVFILVSCVSCRSPQSWTKQIVQLFQEKTVHFHKISWNSYLSYLTNTVPVVPQLHISSYCSFLLFPSTSLWKQQPWPERGQMMRAFEVVIEFVCNIILQNSWCYAVYCVWKWVLIMCGAQV